MSAHAQTTLPPWYTFKRVVYSIMRHGVHMGGWHTGTDVLLIWTTDIMGGYRDGQDQWVT